MRDEISNKIKAKAREKVFASLFFLSLLLAVGSLLKSNNVVLLSTLPSCPMLRQECWRVHEHSSTVMSDVSERMKSDFSY
jgi:hypothetical protein